MRNYHGSGIDKIINQGSHDKGGIFGSVLVGS